MSIEENKMLVTGAINHFNQPESREKYFDLYDTNAVVSGYAGVEPGIESIKQFYRGFWAAFPDMRVIIEDLVAEGDKVACRFHFEGTHRGELMGIPATGKQVSVPGITILRFKNGKCVERWSQADFMAMLQQIGAMPAPA